MNMMRVSGGMIVYVILMCALEIGFSEGRRRLTGTYIGNVACWASPEIDENTVELVWENCRKEIFDMELSVEKNPKAVYFIRRNMHETVSALAPQIKKSLLTCLWKKNIHFGISRNEASSKSLFFDCFEMVHSSSIAPRRYLISKQLAKTHAPAPSSSLAHPTPKSPKPKKPPKQKKTPKQKKIPKPKKPPKPIVLPQSPSKRMHKPRNKKNPDDEKTRVIMIISATILGTCVLAALLFCCLKCARNKISPQDGVKDEWPLLNLSSSDYSNGSSSNKDLSGRGVGIHSGRYPSHKSNLPIMSDLMDEKILQENVNGSTPLPPLKPPPGRTVPVSDPAPLAPDPPPPPPKPGPRPPPPPKAARPPAAPPMKTAHPPPPPPNQGKNNSSEGNDTNRDPNGPKAKLKPFFWDKVLANPDQSMVWHEVNAGSFQFNEEMMENLFGYNTEKNKNNRKTDASSSLDAFPQYIQIIDSRKAQNLSILLRALNVTTDEVCDALREGTKLPTELVQTLLKMAPTTEEELKLRLFSGDPSQLGPAERFLKVLVEIPFPFKRLESLLFMNSLQEEVSTIKESFATLEVACNKLRNSRLFLKLLEAVLKTGNRMNDGTYRGGAQAFKLDTLLKLSDVKGTDGKTTLLHFVVQEIIRSEGVKAARTTTSGGHETEEHFRDLGLQVVSSVSTELGDVKKAAVIDSDGLTTTVSKLGHALAKTQNFLKFEMQNLDEESGFHSTISRFVEKAEVDVTWLQEEDKKIQALVKNTADYFHGNAGKDEGLRLFVIVRDFLVMLDKECKEVRDASMKKAKMVVKKENSIALEFSEARQTQLSANMHLRLFPAMKDRRMDSFSSESDDD